jgi:nicotinate phosphoribosyltransferase
VTAAPPPALLTDLYQLTMLQAYFREQRFDEATFSLHYRRLPPARNYVLACGLDDALGYLETLRFGPDELGALRSLGGFAEDFLTWLAALRFEGDVHAVPEGTPVFPEEPLLEVVAPLPQAQLVESLVLNTLHFQSVVYVAGVAATSHVLAGLRYGIPVTGTMSHSYIEAHDSEREAFRDFTALYPETTLLVDTYDSLEGVRRVVELARERGPAFQVQAVRLDSGDLGALAAGARKLLDAAGLERVRILASGGLDETRVAALRAAGAPIDAFGVGTLMGVPGDAPSLDMAYKLTACGGHGRLKTSPGKRILPGRKQVFRIEEGGRAVRDLLARHDESLPGRPLLEPVMRAGRRLPAGRRALPAIRRHAERALAGLPPRIAALAPAQPPYPVELSAALEKDWRELAARAAGAPEPER